MFLSALLALMPVAEKAKLNWSDDDTDQGWERLATCAFDAFVRAPIAADTGRGRFDVPLAPYDIDRIGYREASRIGVGDAPASARALVRLVSMNGPCDTVQVVDVDLDTGSASLTRLEPRSLHLVRRSTEGALQIVDSVVAGEWLWRRLWKPQVARLIRHSLASSNGVRLESRRDEPCDFFAPSRDNEPVVRRVVADASSKAERPTYSCEVAHHLCASDRTNRSLDGASRASKYRYCLARSSATRRKDAAVHDYDPSSARTTSLEFGTTDTPRQGSAYSKYDGGGGVIAEVDGQGVLGTKAADEVVPQRTV
jgi:hypothetical protein